MIRPNRYVLFASLACAFLAPQARPDEAPAKRKLVARVHVVYDDLNIEKVADARVLLDRLKRAAYRACGGNPRYHYAYAVMPHHTTEVFRECREEALSTAVDEINSPTLTRLFRIDNGRQ
jgi:UrcA family protein